MHLADPTFVHYFTESDGKRLIDGIMSIELCRRPDGNEVWSAPTQVVSCPDCKQIMKERKLRHLLEID